MTKRIVHLYFTTLFLLTSCLAPGAGQGLSAQGDFVGQGFFSTNLEQTVFLVRGEGEVGLYYMDELGQFRLTRPTLRAMDKVVIRDRVTKQEGEFDLGETLPPWTEPVVRAVLAQEKITQWNLVWEVSSDVQ